MEGELIQKDLAANPRAVSGFAGRAVIREPRVTPPQAWCSVRRFQHGNNFHLTGRHPVGAAVFFHPLHHASFA